MSDRRGLAGIYLRRLRAQSPAQTLRSLTDLGRLKVHAGRLLHGRIETQSNYYDPSWDEDAEIDYCAALLDRPRSDIEKEYGSLDGGDLEAELAARYAQFRPGSAFHLGRFRMLWVFVRALKPSLIVETGVHDGLSSSVILAALEANGGGRLVSIDLPSTDLPPGVSSAGWLVPDRLRSRWELHVGDSKVLLPGVVAEVGEIDLFIHDSDHSQEHQRFEYSVVVPRVAAGGLVLSDHDFPEETAVEEVATRYGGVHVQARMSASGDSYVGGVRLPPRP